MTASAPDRISLTVDPKFLDLFLASFTVARYHPVLFVAYAFFPLSGLLLLILPLIVGRALRVSDVLSALLALAFMPLVTLLSLWSIRRRNKLAQGPFTYVFDAEGLHTRGGAFSQSIKWSGIFRVRKSKRFLLIFIAPTRAFVIPLAALVDQGVLDEVVAMVRQHGELR